MSMDETSFSNKFEQPKLETGFEPERRYPIPEGDMPMFKTGENPGQTDSFDAARELQGASPMSAKEETLNLMTRLNDIQKTSEAMGEKDDSEGKTEETYDLKERLDRGIAGGKISKSEYATCGNFAYREWGAPNKVPHVGLWCGLVKRSTVEDFIDSTGNLGVLGQFKKNVSSLNGKDSALMEGKLDKVLGEIKQNAWNALDEKLTDSPEYMYVAIEARPPTVDIFVYEKPENFGSGKPSGGLGTRLYEGMYSVDGITREQREKVGTLALDELGKPYSYMEDGELNRSKFFENRNNMKEDNPQVNGQEAFMCSSFLEHVYEKAGVNDGIGLLAPSENMMPWDIMAQLKK